MTLTVRDCIKTAMRQIGAVGSGEDPTADEMADSVIALNRIRRTMSGTQIGPRLGPHVLTGSSGQAENGGEYVIPAGAFTLNAPQNPKSGGRFGVVDGALNWGAHPLTITAPGLLINGVTANYVISTTGQNTRFWYRGDTGNWIIEQDYTNLDAPLDFPDVIEDYIPAILAVVLAPEFGQDVPQAVALQAQEGRDAIIRTYGRRGRNTSEPPIGQSPPPQAQRGG